MMHQILTLIEAENSARVMYETFGHFDAKQGEKHAGHFVFINGQHGDMCVLHSDFPSFGEGPGYFSDRQDFIWSLVKDNGPCSAVGVYRFDGAYVIPKRKRNPRFSGKVICLQTFGVS